MYWKYFKYIIEHKWNVGVECFLNWQFIHAITHDLSKFRPSEFFPYARFFHATDRTANYRQADEINQDFQKGWFLHQKRNKHHWNYWVSVTRKDELIPMPMPEKYVRQMVADWRGMSRKFGGTASDYYDKNRDKMILHPATVERLARYV
jgi:hypothetical protein